MRYTIILLLLTGVLTGCFDDGDCITSSTNLLRVDFREFETNIVDTVNIQGIKLAGSDSVFHQNILTPSIVLPLDPNVTSLKINFTFETVEREMILNYSTVPRLISPDCGVELNFVSIIANEKNYNFDSVAVVATSLDEQITSNIVIYQ